MRGDYHNVIFKYGLYVSVVFFALILVILSLCSCEAVKTVIKTEGYINIFLDGKKIEDEADIYSFNNRVFLNLKLISKHIEINPKLNDGAYITHFIDIGIFPHAESIKSYFYNPHAVIFRIPVLKRQGEDYIDLEYLEDFWAFKKLDLGENLAIFSPKYDKTPDSAALLRKSSKISYVDKADELIEKTLPEDIEIYYNSDNIDGSVMFYSEYYAIGVAKADDLSYISKHEYSVKTLSPKKLKNKYGKNLMVFDDIASYDYSLENMPSNTYDAINVVIPSFLSYRSSKVSCSASHSYMSASSAAGCDVIAGLSLDNNSDLSYIYSDEFAMKSAIDSIVLYSLYYGFSGLDIDIRGADDTKIAELATFLGRLSMRAKSAELVFVFNIYPDEISSRAVYLNPLNTSVDYYIAMIIDEDIILNKPYPVQRNEWLRAELDELTEKLPSEKIILTQASYIRAYEIKSGSDKPISYVVYPRRDFISKTDGLIMEHYRDEELGQLFYKYKNPDSDSYFITWIDDEDGIREKTDIIRENNLEGLAIRHYIMLDNDFMSIIKRALYNK